MAFLFARHETIYRVVALTSNRSWHLYQLDVKYSFLNVILEKTTFVTQPLNFEEKGNREVDV